MNEISPETNKSSTVLKVRRPKFLSYFEDMVRINAVLGVAFFAVCLLCIALTFVLVRSALTPRPIYYVPGANNAGFSNPNEIPAGSIASFAASWLLNLMNFSPETIDAVHERAKKFMSPHLLSQSRFIFEKESSEVKRSSISSIYSLTQEPQLKEDGQSLTVVLEGDHGLFMGKTNIKRSSVTYTMILQKAPPTETNPYGLLVKDIQKKEIPKEVHP